jgi:hypothetical protein
MKAIDSLLKILVQQGGTELRLAADRRPQMFKEDVELPLTIPAMSTQALSTALWRGARLLPPYSTAPSRLARPLQTAKS